jgi:hypothetical protein
MSRKRAVDPGDAEVALAPAVTPEQRLELHTLGWRGPSPSTEAQASAILERLRSAPAGTEDTEPYGHDHG